MKNKWKNLVIGILIAAIIFMFVFAAVNKDRYMEKKDCAATKVFADVYLRNCTTIGLGPEGAREPYTLCKQNRILPENLAMNPNYK